MSETQPRLDYAAALENMAGMTDLYQEAAAMFLQDTPELLAGFSTALQRGDLPEARRMAHSLKSSAAMVGAMQLSAEAKEAEMACRALLESSGSVAGLESCAGRLTEEWQALVPLLQAQLPT